MASTPPTAIPSTAQAVSASVACARMLGLPWENPVVIAEGYSVRVLLAPAPVVTRVLTVGRILRGDPLPWLEREVSVARFLDAAGARVVGPWSSPGPYVAERLEVSLWRWTEHSGVEVGQAVFGAMLGELHDALATYSAELPPLVGPLTDIASALEISGDPVLHAAARTLVPQALSWPRRPLHGDAHLGNVMLTPDGPMWTDFEDVCAGPVEWDLASVSLTTEAVEAYPGQVDRALLKDCRGLRRLQILSGLLTDDLQDPSIYAETVAALKPYC